MNLQIITCFGLVLSFSEGHQRSSVKYCNSGECKHVAEYFSDRMDPKVNPCNNFYDFTCGKFMKNKDKNNTQDTFTKIALLTLQQQLDLIESDINPANDSVPFQKAKLFYQTCMNVTHKSDPMLTIYNKIEQLGGWPLRPTDDGPEDGNYLISLVRKARQIGFDTKALMDINVFPNVKNTSKRILVIGPPNLIVGPETSAKKATAYIQLMLDVALQFLRYTNSDAQLYMVQELVSNVMEMRFFELDLVEIVHSSETVKDDILFPAMDVKTIAHLQKAYPFLNWLEYVQAAFLGTNATIDSSEEVILAGEKYFDAFSNLYNMLADKRVVKQYIVWRYIFHSLRMLGSLEDHSRWLTCFDLTSGGFQFIMDANYIKRYFSSSNKELIVDMVHKSKKALAEKFQKYDWVDQATKSHVLEKIDAIAIKVAYTDDIMNSETTELHLFESMVIDPNDFFSSVLYLTKLSLDKMAASLHKPVDRNEWDVFFSTTTVNAFYAPFSNSITIPAGLLQKELYSADRPSYLNYGSIGSIIGHELSHSIDITGRLFDKYGNVNLTLWDSATVLAYESKTHCFIDQYNKYTLGSSDIHLDGALTLDENIADNEGLGVAYEAYKMLEKEKGAAEWLSGLNYNADQLFWISMGNVWCSNMNETELLERAKVDEHAPGNLRVIGTVSNSKTFSEIFGCPAGSPMNPQTKCSFN